MKREKSTQWSEVTRLAGRRWMWCEQTTRVSFRLAFVDGSCCFFFVAHSDRRPATWRWFMPEMNILSSGVAEMKWQSLWPYANTNYKLIHLLGGVLLHYFIKFAFVLSFCVAPLRWAAGEHTCRAHIAVSCVTANLFKNFPFDICIL